MGKDIYKIMYEKALEASKNAYAPYSNFKVGACVLMKDGTLIQGCNVENASYGLSNCAERTAIFTAIAKGYKKGDFDKLIEIGNTDGLCYPCGACRQVMAEFFDKDDEIICGNYKGEYKVYRLEELLPYSFNKEDLN